MHSGVAAMPPSSTSSTAAMALRGAKKRKEGFTSPTLPAAVSPAPLGRPAAAGSRATVGVTPNTHGGAAALMSMGMLDTAATPRGLDAAAAIVAAAGAAALPTAAAAGGVVTGARQDGAAVGAFVAGAADEASEDGVGDFNCDQWRRQWMQEEDEVRCKACSPRTPPTATLPRRAVHFTCLHCIFARVLLCLVKNAVLYTVCVGAMWLRRVCVAASCLYTPLCVCHPALAVVTVCDRCC